MKIYVLICFVEFEGSAVASVNQSFEGALKAAIDIEPSVSFTKDQDQNRWLSHAMIPHEKESEYDYFAIKPMELKA